MLSVIPNHKAEERTAFDGRGFVLLALAVGCLTYGLDLIAGQKIDAPLALTLIACAAAAGVAAVRHLDSAKTPLVQLSVLRRREFFIASVSGGGISRAAISATPFLLPLMLEVAYGYTPLDAGMLLLIYMLANLLMKAVTNPIIRRFGLRNVLMVNGAIVAAGIAACAILAPGLPLGLTALILFIAGASRSMQFTAMLFTTFAEVTQEERSPASVLFSLTQQISMAVGVAAAALTLNFSRLLRHATTLSPFDFRLALILMGGFGLLAVPAYARLDRYAGAEVSGHRP